MGTPELPDGSADMKYVEQAARSIGNNAPGRSSQPLIIVNKSTVPIGTGDLVGQLIRKECPPEFKLAVVSNPEFLREGQAVFDFMHPDRIVLGSEERWAGEEVAQLYEPAGSARDGDRLANGRDDQVRVKCAAGHLYFVYQ